MKDVSPERIINAAGEIIKLIQDPISLKKGLLYKCSNDARLIIDKAINEYKVVSLWQEKID